MVSTRSSFRQMNCDRVTGVAGNHPHRRHHLLVEGANEVSKTVLTNTQKYFLKLLEEMREAWRAGTIVQRQSIENKAKFVQILLDDVDARLEAMAT